MGVNGSVNVLHGFTMLAARKKDVFYSSNTFYRKPSIQNQHL